MNKNIKIKTLLSGYDDLDRLTLLQWLKVLSTEIKKAQPLLSKVNEGANIKITYDEEGNVIISATGDISTDWKDIDNIPTTLLYSDKDAVISGKRTIKNIDGLVIYNKETDKKHLSIHSTWLTIVDEELNATIIDFPTENGKIAIDKDLEALGTKIDKDLKDLDKKISDEIDALDARVETTEDSISDLDTYKANKEEEIVLWENANPTEVFVSQDVTITGSSIENYKRIIILYHADIGFPNSYNIKELPIVKSFSGRIQFEEVNYTDNDVSSYQVRSGTYIENANNIKVHFGDARNNSGVVVNNFIVPVKIIGIKDVDIPTKKEGKKEGK